MTKHQPFYIQSLKTEGLARQFAALENVGRKYLAEAILYHHTVMTEGDAVLYPDPKTDFGKFSTRADFMVDLLKPLLADDEVNDEFLYMLLNLGHQLETHPSDVRTLSNLLRHHPQMNIARLTFSFDF